MKAKGFDGKERQIKVDRKKSKNPSSLHLRARNLLAKLYPFYTFYEEVTLPGSSTDDNNTLYADFLCLRPKICVETHGIQHYEFSSRFHKDKLDLVKGQNRDNVKREWCELNGFQLIELPYNEDDKEWKKRIKEAL
jgi:hypothetical protein